MMLQMIQVLRVSISRMGIIAVFILTVSSAFAEGPAGIVLYLVEGQNVFLLLADHSKHTRGWSAFGGGADPGETQQATAARETYEETRGYFSQVWLSQQISKQEPVRSKGYSMYFVEVPFVPAQRVMNNPTEEKNKAMVERRCYAWIPFSEIEAILEKDNLSTEHLRMNPLYLPACSKSDSFWHSWIKNMHGAMKQGAFPWSSPVTNTKQQPECEK
ncbi:MAG: NUDIX domain-containing protein [Desulfatiglandales bacterium]